MRSPHARAKINKVDIYKALKADGGRQWEWRIVVVVSNMNYIGE